MIGSFIFRVRTTMLCIGFGGAASAASMASPIAMTPIQACLQTMDGAMYHGDPSDRSQMRKNVLACRNAIAQMRDMRPTVAQGPEKLFLAGRLLDRTATLTYVGLDDAVDAAPEVRTANLYFRIAAGLPGQSTDYRAAALANVELTRQQLETLESDLLARQSMRARVVALHHYSSRDRQ